MARTGSYWDSTGKYQEINNKLHTLIPSEGACEDAEGKNRKLEKLRVATNCYYDLFNNVLTCANGAARYMIGYDDQETEDQMYASIVYVTIGSDKLVADYGGGPEFETDDLEALTKYFADRCN